MKPSTTIAYAQTKRKAKRGRKCEVCQSRLNRPPPFMRCGRCDPLVKKAV